MTRNSFAALPAVLLAIGLLAAGCGTTDSNVQLDSRKTVHQKTPAEIQAIQNNPHIPPAVKARMLGQNNGAPPTAAKTQAGPGK